MLVIIAGRQDRAARGLADRWTAQGHDARLVVPDDLARPGWQLRVGQGGSDAATLIVGGETVPATQVHGVVNRLPGVSAADLRHIHPDDGPYVAAEMSAFLLAWLSGLRDAVVVNQPTAEGLCGPVWAPERWAVLAARLGIPTGPTGRQVVFPPDAPHTAGSAIGRSGVTITVVGDRCLGGAADPHLCDQALILARASGADLLDVRFGDASPGAALVSVSVWPDVSRSDVADALLAYLLDSQTCVARERGCPAPPMPAPRSGRILLWGLRDEEPLARVRAELDEQDVPYVFLDQADVLATEVCLHVDGAGRVQGAIRAPGVACDLADVAAAYVRPYDSRRLPQVARAGPGSPEWRHAVGVEEALWTWTEVTPALVLNRPSVMASNGSKPYQLALIGALGFEVPETLVTTDPAAALAFWEAHGTLVYKSVSSVRSIVSRLGPEHQARLADVAACPTQFQAYVPGTDVRVHVVGDAVLACALESNADDYRYHGDLPVEVQACRLPADVEQRCRDLAAGLGLPVAGIDMRRTPDDHWYCFEVNPSPGYSYFQHAAGLPISAAIARLLVLGAAGASGLAPNTCARSGSGGTGSLDLAAALEPRVLAGTR